jgi:hypothetical protein
MKDAPRQQFRWAPHVSGAASVKPKDYEPPQGSEAEIEAESEYAVWALLKQAERPLGIGDLLEMPGGELRICKYVGFDSARWFVPEPAPTAEPPVESAPREAAQV